MAYRRLAYPSEASYLSVAGQTLPGESNLKRFAADCTNCPRCAHAGAGPSGTGTTVAEALLSDRHHFGQLQSTSSSLPARCAFSPFQVSSKHKNLQDDVYSSFPAGTFPSGRLPWRSRSGTRLRTTQVFVVQHSSRRWRNTGAYAFAPAPCQHHLTRPQADSVFSGISTFGRLPYFPCLASKDETYDIAFIGNRSPQDRRPIYRADQHRCTIRHRHFIQTRSSIWPQRYQARFQTPQSLVRRITHKLTSGSRLTQSAI